MAKAVGEEESAFLGAQNPRPLTIPVGRTAGAEDNSISRRDRPRATRTRTLLAVRHWSIPIRKAEISQTPLGQDAPLASTRVLQWSARGGQQPRPRYSVPCLAIFLHEHDIQTRAPSTP